jgi:hypothetical protein
MALGDMGVLAIAVNDERVRGGDFGGVLRPADADLGLDSRPLVARCFASNSQPAGCSCSPGAWLFGPAMRSTDFSANGEGGENQRGEAG